MTEVFSRITMNNLTQFQQTSMQSNPKNNHTNEQSNMIYGRKRNIKIVNGIYGGSRLKNGACVFFTLFINMFNDLHEYSTL